MIAIYKHCKAAQWVRVAEAASFRDFYADASRIYARSSQFEQVSSRFLGLMHTHPIPWLIAAFLFGLSLLPALRWLDARLLGTLEAIFEPDEKAFSDDDEDDDDEEGYKLRLPAVGARENPPPKIQICKVGQSPSRENIAAR